MEIISQYVCNSMVECHNLTIILAQTVNSECKNAYFRYAECNMSSVVMLIVVVKKKFCG